MSSFDQSFFGPMTEESGERVREHYPTFTHWIQVAKFDTSLKDERMEILLTPSAKQAVRSAQRSRSKIRPDWPMVRLASITQGLCFYYLHNPAAYGNAEAIKSLERQIQGEGLSVQMAASLMQQAAVSLGAPRVLMLGHGGVSPIEVSKKLRQLQRKYGGSWNLVHWLGRHSGWLVHDSVLSERRPVIYLGKEKERITKVTLDLLQRETDHIVIFRGRDSESVEVLLPTLKSVGKAVEIVLPSEPQIQESKRMRDATAAQTSLF